MTKKGQGKSCTTLRSVDKSTMHSISEPLTNCDSHDNPCFFKIKCYLVNKILLSKLAVT